MLELTKTGIEGLDDVLNGGIVKKSTTLVSGNPGAGKSLLGLEFIYRGVREFDEQGIYLSFEENESDLREAAESIGFEEWGKYVDEGKIKVFDKQKLIRQNDFSSSLEILLEELQNNEYDRLVLDSLSMFQLFFDTERERRTYLLKFMDILQEDGLTTLLINEQSKMFPSSGIGLENFLTDGNIYLIQTPTKSGVSRYLWVAKMRKKNINTDIFPMEISEGGLKVHNKASAYTMMGDEEGFPL